MKNILIVHDISCYGKCSSTVALPILAMMELAGTLLPTSLLSTHTGPGFEGYTYLDLSDEMAKIVDHWQSFGLTFDAVYVGYLGSIEQIDFLIEKLPQLIKSGGKIYLDPVMADQGKFYPGFDEAYAKAMRKLCDIADVIMPNQTEAAFIYDFPYQEGLVGYQSAKDLAALINRDSDQPTSLVLTGVGYDGDQQTGAYYYDAENKIDGLIQADFVGGLFHGTGDIFASIFVGARENGASLKASTALAVETLPKILQASIDNPNIHQDGLDFEKACSDLNRFVYELKNK
ncbi:bifunctional hydroxymethylpyrimidine kinase/phosphomethylpyrimidine kinase [Aerococcus urinae]|uniref:bifunctional hydroxymethylpyrimidine kinase/phosphomethylpyrimidine kinase n=1 Tax=Aerococcus urinae TaxID=1376 RepID=UPI00254A25C5|nr:bifunctional hydroxymethylpyrimidine kinase/phosphomethylpyrimidine kinase [Aerococcus urinae]MDK7802181.1 bifunctional hydroxymethylpyrimidine kinase/phosphomethylpyrimidine kinase [Aerococcus urinae]MDK8655767.1 bifunctional hydroxymethylpyrimidine kinase/phosphomethylpyrimidine kinase [Aerococcus urinae]